MTLPPYACGRSAAIDKKNGRRSARFCETRRLLFFIGKNADFGVHDVDAAFVDGTHHGDQMIAGKPGYDFLPFMDSNFVVPPIGLRRDQLDLEVISGKFSRLDPFGERILTEDEYYEGYRVGLEVWSLHGDTHYAYTIEGQYHPRESD